MIIVMSDLHFSEALSTQIRSKKFNRNLPPEAFSAYFSELNHFAKLNDIKNVDIVLAGDILEISRSALWLDSEYRPYINNDDVLPDSEVENIILKIIDTIAKEEKVMETLSLFRKITEFFEMDVTLHLILGNHDRLGNATPKIRERIRQMFGKDGGSTLINNYLILRDDQNLPFCLIRHGHEYDPTNFSLDMRRMESIPPDLPLKYYGQSCLGDITTIEFGAALSWLFVKEYGEEAIIQDETLMAIYERLMEFDDVRPTTAWLAYLFSTPGVEKRQTWKWMKPTFTQVVNTLIDHDEFNQTLKQSGSIGKISRVILTGMIKLGFFRKGIPYWLIKRIMNIVSKTIKLKSQANWAKREALIQNIDSGCKCVISGHTHFAEVSLLSSKMGDDRYYINTGTWRNIIPATKNYQDFGRLKALTKVIVFYPKEQKTVLDHQRWSFHYLSGVSFGTYRLI